MTNTVVPTDQNLPDLRKDLSLISQLSAQKIFLIGVIKIVDKLQSMLNKRLRTLDEQLTLIQKEQHER